MSSNKGVDFADALAQFDEALRQDPASQTVRENREEAAARVQAK